MDREYLIRLSWPAKPLWQNHKCHWAVRAKSVRFQRHEALILCRKFRVISDPKSVLEFTFCPPPRSRPDIHNMPATVKGAIDGVADAMGVDDQKFKCVWPDEFASRTPGGCVLIHIKPAPKEGVK